MVRRGGDCKRLQRQPAGGQAGCGGGFTFRFVSQAPWEIGEKPWIGVARSAFGDKSLCAAHWRGDELQSVNGQAKRPIG
jgi:hypothetical protein